MATFLETLTYLFVTLFFNENGLYRGFWEVVAFIYYRNAKKGKQGRFDVYKTSERSPSLETMAVFVHPTEDKLEMKRPLATLTSKPMTVPTQKDKSKNEENSCGFEGEVETDNIVFYGGNSRANGARLLVRISRNGNGLTTAWLYLKLENGITYQLPKEKFYVEPKTGSDCFVAGGLRVRCLIANRRWRISYNGILRSHCEDIDSNTLQHVKFSLIWTTSSSPFDLSHDIHPKLWSKYLSKQENWNETISQNGIFLNKWVQSGNMLGTIEDYTAGTGEQELYFWGMRKRSLDMCVPSCPVKTREIFAYAKSGEFLNYGEITYPCQTDKLMYGFIMFSNGIGGAVRNIKSTIDQSGNECLYVSRGPFTRKFEVQNSSNSRLYSNGDIVRSSTKATLTTIRLDDEEDGHALILEYSRDKEHVNVVKLPKPVFKRSQLDDTFTNEMVLSLSDKVSLSSDISGGKGSSLTELTILSKTMPSKFNVPRGVVVTANAYEFLLKHTKIEEFIKDIEYYASSDVKNLKNFTAKTTEAIEDIELSDAIKEELKEKLDEEFSGDFQSKKFAIRSSASGEDSEELSTAGQMTTYLGITGFNEICKCVMKCWASQFSFIAVEYKRQNGQIINSPMAVVVQEMVPADVAGVMFTCDPVTGNPQHITITANYGIGESVVSASAEPDTFIIERDEDGLTGVITCEIGKKSFQTVMSESGGVVEEKVSSTKANETCLSKENSKKLAEIGIAIEEAFGCPVDIEWGISKEEIYLLQARPITTLDKETNYELEHEYDSNFRSEEEITSTCNIGEVMPGAQSFLGATCTFKAIELPNTWHYTKRMKGSTFVGSPHFIRGAGVVQNHNLFNIYDIVLRFYHGESSMITDCQMVSLFGRLLEGEEMFRKAAKRNQYYPPNSVLKQTLYILYDILTCRKQLRELREELWNQTIDISKCKTSKEAHDELWQQFLSLVKIIPHHGTCSMVSSLYNLVLLSNLVKGNKGWGENVYKDFAYFLGTCGEVESADVPSALQHLAVTIRESTIASSFKEKNTKDALNLLLTSSCDAGLEFRKFLKNHGHRCYKEFDVISVPWGTDPEQLIKTLQEMVDRPGLKFSKKKVLSIAETLSNLTVPLSWKSKLILRIVIPLCRKAVGMRETSKSIMIKMFDAARHAYRDLANLMVKEGRLPDAQLIYYLSVMELDNLMKTRSPLLIQKAIRRRNLLPKMDKVIFPEIMTGIPKPINFEQKERPQGSILVKGVPVSNGVAEGFARVATTLEEASEIQAGEILIAYSTDIGWSPYFPMLAGVATEIGGLISHGAVVAREYGLPCIVGVEEATVLFRTGDRVILNASNGTLERIE